MNNLYVVIFKTVLLKTIPITVYISKVISYKKELEDGVRVCFHISKAHKYKSEKNAIKAAQFCHGEIKIFKE